MGTDAADKPSGNELAAMFGSENVKYMAPNGAHTFQDSRKAEIQGLQNRKTFDVVKRESVPAYARIYGTR